MLLVSVYLILLFHLIVVSFSPSVFLFRCLLHPLPLPLSSCLGCIPPLIGLPFPRFMRLPLVWGTRFSILDCHVLKGFGIYMIGILGR